MARFAEARKNNLDLLTDIERLLLAENEIPTTRRQDVIHPSEMAKSDWCPRSTFLRIRLARAGQLQAEPAHRFQLENIFEEGHEYHRKWQARIRRMNRLWGRWKCENCGWKWFACSPDQCDNPECSAPADALTYIEVPLVDKANLIYGNADGLVLAAPGDDEDALIEIKSVGEGTVRQEVPKILQEHTYTVEGPWGREKKVLDHRGVWKDVTKPFAPHLRQGWIYLRLLNAMDASVPGYEPPGVMPQRVVFLYEYKPTSAVKAFYVARNDDAVQDLWDSCGDIVYALEGGREPWCVRRDESCDECKKYEKQAHPEQNTEHTDDDGQAQDGREVEGQPARRARARRRTIGPALEATPEPPHTGRGPDRPRGRGADDVAGGVHALGGLLGRAARPR